MKTINNDENDFKIRTKIAASFGARFCNNKPIPNGISKQIANDAIRPYGTTKCPCSKIDRPNVNIQNGIIPNAANVLIAVIDIDKSRLPPKITHQIFDAPPDGETPVKNRPSCISILFGNNSKPSP